MQEGKQILIVMTTLKHFTTIAIMKKILNDGFRLSDGSNWEDKNDKYALTLFQKKFPNARVLCFCKSDATIHHWHYYSKHTHGQKCSCESIEEDKAGCYIGLDKEAFLNHVNSLGDKYLCKSVEYKYLNELKKMPSISLEELLFVKRKGFKVDDELRIVCKDLQNNEDAYIKDIVKYIKTIYFSKDVPFNQVQEIKKTFKDKFPHIKVRRSKLSDSKEWQMTLKEKCTNE